MKKFMCVFAGCCLLLSLSACTIESPDKPDLSSVVPSDYSEITDLSDDLGETTSAIIETDQESEKSTTICEQTSQKSTTLTQGKSDKKTNNRPSQTTQGKSGVKQTTIAKTKATTASVFLTGITAQYIGKAPKVGDKISANDFCVIANYSNKTSKEINNFSVSISKFEKIGKTTVTVTYQTKTCAIKLNVLAGNDPNANPGSEFGYSVKDGELTITQYVGAKTDVIVPAWIDDMPVTGIENLSDDITSVVLPDSIKTLKRHAFSDYDNLISVTLGPNISSIGDNAFYHCDKLKNVTFKAGAKLVGDSMFSSCKSLEKVVLPEGIERIEDSAFFYCENLKFITIPESVKNIGDYATFSSCYKLEKIYVKQGSYAQRWLLNEGYGKLLVY